ncbi:tetratricopeptide (TPR) repeat protein [Actinoplanes tereljensis]|uniref:FxSxx-COOH system tetratricopeptide repeat protein n=1 Tax=Paractinoplanes tereljensis TaxID=571912 RepID=UPI0019456F16|nr:FxSxx-COOH system tetratricopeptide repeat protein [Actinoplanes tereljensis]
MLISFIRQDQAWAGWVGTVLTRAGMTVARQWWDFSPDQDYDDLAGQSVREASTIVVLLSPAFANSLYASREWLVALRQRTSDGSPVIAVVVEPAPVPEVLRFDRIIDLAAAEQDEELARTLIVDGIVPLSMRDSRPPGAAPPPRFPGRPAPIQNLPPRNPNFTGRVAEIDRLHAAISARLGPAVVTPAQTVHGLGGIGKTQLLIEYAYRFAVEYDIIWWIPAEQNESISTAITGLASQMAITQHNFVDDTVTAVWNALTQRGRWLLIFDNADSPEQIEKYWPPQSGHVLISSRNPSWRRVAAPVELPVMRESEAVAFLGKRLRGDQGPDGSAAAEDDRRAVAWRLGYLPLVLEQAAAYMEDTGLEPADYLELLAEVGEREMLDRGRPAFHQDNMNRTLDLSTEEIRKSPEAAALLTLCSFLYPDDLPRDLLARHIGKMPRELRRDLSVRLRFDDAVGVLSRYSIVSAANRGMRIHRLVQSYARERLSNEEQVTWINAIAAWIITIAPTDDLRIDSRNQADRLVPHVRGLVDHLKLLLDTDAASGIEVPIFVRLFDLAGVYLHRVGRLADADGALRRALTLIEYLPPGPDRALQEARLRSKLGGVLHDQASPGAVEQLLDALREAESSGVAPAKTATIRSRYGRYLQETGKLRPAEEELERALADASGGYPSDSPVIAAICSNLGRTLQDLGRMPDAQVQYEKALAITGRRFGENDVRVPPRRNDLAGVLQYRGFFEDAVRQLESALDATCTAYGARRIPQALPIFVNLGAVRHDLGDHAGAHDAFEEALTVVEALGLADHASSAVLYTNIGALLLAEGRGEASEQWHRRALGVIREPGPRTGTWILVIQNNLGPALYMSNRAEEALDTLGEALRTCERTFGPDHPRTAAVRSAFGNTLLRLGQPRAAASEQRTAIDDTEPKYGSDHHRMAVYRNNLGLAIHALGRHDEARREFAEAERIAFAKFGPDHPGVRLITGNIVLLDAGEPPVAELHVTLRIHQRLRAVDG